jgi:hypothetical protein
MPRTFSSVLAPLLAAYSSSELLLLSLGPGNERVGSHCLGWLSVTLGSWSRVSPSTSFTPVLTTAR